MNIVEKEKPEGVIVQFGGQTPLNLAVPLMRAGVPILGTSPDAIDRAEDRERFQALIEKLGLLQPPNGTAMDLDQALAAHRVRRGEGHAGSGRAHHLSRGGASQLRAGRPRHGRGL